MTAPGNSALLFILTAVFVACAGYAAGRLHQRFQMEQDREEAYRDGYDMATRSVFSTAVRLIAPRRAARAVAGRPVLDGSVVPDQSARTAMPPSAADGSPASAVPSAERDAVSLGFPVPPRPPSRIVGEPPASPGGVVYRPFPDPRFVGGAEPLPADRGSLHIPPVPPISPSPHISHPSHPVSAPGGPGAGAAVPGFAAAGSADEPTQQQPGRSGKHTVPDELVQAATYRLPPDRVFRAKVPDATNAPGLPEEPTTRIAVSKPRQS